MRAVLSSLLAVPLLAFAAPLTICNICDGAVVQRDLSNAQLLLIVCPNGTVAQRISLPCAVGHVKWERQAGMLTITCG